VNGAGRNKVSIIYDDNRFDLVEIIGSRYPEMNSDGIIKEFDN
jgi:hypothetical protein